MELLHQQHIPALIIKRANPPSLQLPCHMPERACPWSDQSYPVRIAPGFTLVITLHSSSIYISFVSSEYQCGISHYYFILNGENQIVAAPYVARTSLDCFQISTYREMLWEMLEHFGHQKELRCKMRFGFIFFFRLPFQFLEKLHY